MNLRDLAPRRSRNPETKNAEGENAVIFGLTGFGKSFMVARLARLRAFGTVHDAKGTFRLPGAKRFTRLRKLCAANPRKTPWTIYAPDRVELRDEGAQQAYFEWIYQRGNTTAIIDELTAVATTRGDMPSALYDLLARGREFGNEVWSCTQEPIYVPAITLTQARNRYTFYIALEAHQKKVCSLMPGMEVEDILALEKSQFHYYREGEKTIDTRGPFKIAARGESLTVGGVPS